MFSVFFLIVPLFYFPHLVSDASRGFLGKSGPCGARDIPLSRLP